MTEGGLARAGPSAPRARGLLALCRVSNLPTVWCNVLAALVLSNAFAGGSFLVLALSLSAFYCAGMCFNDICDRELDARDQPFRPIPSGRVTLTEAWTTAFALFGLGFALLALVPHPSAVLPACMLAGLIGAYDILHKRHPWTVILMAGCRFMVFAVCGWAVTGGLVALVLAAGAVQLAYTLLVTVVARYENGLPSGFGFPVVPWMLAGMCLVDGLVLTWAVGPVWLLPTAGGAVLTRFAQRYVRGD